MLPSPRPLVAISRKRLRGHRVIAGTAVDVGEADRWLRLIGVHGIDRASAGWVRASCPLAFWRHAGGHDRRPSFGMRIEPGDGWCFCHSCHFSGSQTELAMELSRLGAPIDFQSALRAVLEAEEGCALGDVPTFDELRARPALVEYPESMVRALEPAYADGTVHPYLELRMVPYWVAERLDLRWDSARHRVVFPIRDFEGRLRGLHGRHVGVDPEVPYLAYNRERANNLRFCWLGEHLVDRERAVVLVESVFDFARTVEVYDNVLSPLRSGVTREQLDRITWARRIVTLFDADEAGDHARERVMRGLTRGRGRVVHARPPRGHKDPGEMTPGEIDEILLPLLGVT